MASRRAFPTASDPTRSAALTAGAATLSAAAIALWLVGSVAVAGGFIAAALVLFGLMLAWAKLAPRSGEAGPALADWSLANALAEASADAVAVTDRSGRLVCANQRFQGLFDGFPTPPGLPLAEDGVAELTTAGRAAWRDGRGHVERLLSRGTPLSVDIARAGAEQDMLVWRFSGAEGLDLAASAAALLNGHHGDRLAAAGIMLALVSPDGRIRAANRVFRARAMGHEEGAIAGGDFARFLVTDSRGLVRFEREGLTGVPVRVLQIPFLDGDDAPLLVALIDEEEGIGERGGAAQPVKSLISLLPVGLALVDRDSRFIQMNDAFARAAEVDPANPPVFPGDLVVREDKTAVADAIRRFANGSGHVTDIAFRLKGHPDEPVALTIAGARGLGDAAVLLSLKDNSEESRLKREVEQATKMRAVGQLAGGVAHDFNNVLTAIIGHCDLMLMRHSPGDSDYDDIQQVKANSNRAASLTRQLLAFSRQQTLRPQVLQLPDVISEV